MVSRLKCQVNKHCIKFDNSLKTTIRKRLLEPEQTHEAGDETELTERKEPERERSETITSEARLQRAWEPQPRPGQDRRRCTSRQPSSAKTDALQTYGCVHIWLDIT